jgi:hypothetical protein
MPVVCSVVLLLGYQVLLAWPIWAFVFQTVTGTGGNSECLPHLYWTTFLLWKFRLFVRFFNQAPCHEGILGSKGIAPRILTSALDGGEWSASRPGCFTPRERGPSTHWIGGWVGPRAGLDAVVKRKVPSPRRESNPRTPIVQLAA